VKQKFISGIIIIACFLVFIGLRLWPYIDNEVPLGYDPGIYLDGFKNFPFTNPWLKAMFPPGLFALVKAIPVDPTYLVIPLILFFSTLLFFSVYLFVNRLFGKKAAWWAIFLLSCSLVQYRVYYWYYLKNIAALAFLFFTFYCLSGKSYWAIFWGVLTVYFHTPTDFILYSALVSGFIFFKNRRPYFLLTLILTLLLAAPYIAANFSLSFGPILRGIVTTIGGPGGTFYEPLEVLVLGILYLPLGLYAFIKNYKKCPFLILPVIGLLVTAILKLFFYRRLLIYLDIFLLIFAADYLSKIKNKVFLIVFIILNLVYVVFFVKRTAYPLINFDEFREIQQIEVDGYLLATDEMNSPWLLGYSRAKQVISTGLNPADNYWSQEEWKRFWRGTLEQEITLLKTLPQPLYIYHSDSQPKLPFVDDYKCFEKISWRVYKFKCN
jgi:hypothetical protein